MSQSVLHLAASELNLPFVKMLVEWKGADGSRIELNKLTQSNDSPLLLAIQSALSFPSNDNVEEDEENEDKMEVEKEEKELKDPLTPEGFQVIQYLVEAGANIDFKEEDIPHTAFRQTYGRQRKYFLQVLNS